MKTIVAKFGGSSTANAARFRRILDIIRADPARRCVVLSAPGTDENHSEKVTSLLYQCWDARENAAERGRINSEIQARFAEIAAELGVNDGDDFVKTQINAALSISTAHTASRGEYLCARLFSRWSRIPMLDAASAVTFDSDGKLDEARTLRNFRDAAGCVTHLVVPGFYGADAAHRIHTLPRNGSDVTGALAAVGFGADLYENWTDVPGLMTADPSVVPTARTIARVSYRQMRALADAGARVLHQDCLAPVSRANIPTLLRSTFAPGLPGTLITNNCKDVARCLALRDASDGLRIITAFGLSKAAIAAIQEKLRPLKVEYSDGRVSLWIEADHSIEIAREIHDTYIL